MPTIVNTYRTPGTSLAETLNGLGNTMFGKGALEGDLLRERTLDSRRTNQSYHFLQDEAARRGITPDFVRDPRIQSAIIGLPQPKEFFEANRGIQAVTQGAMAPDTTNAFVGAGGAYQNTGPGHMSDLANRTGIARIQADTAAQTAIRTAEMTPTNVVDPEDSRRMKIVARKSAIDAGMTPVVNNSDTEGFLKMRGFDTGYAGQNPQQQKAAGVLPPQDHYFNWEAANPAGGVVRGTTTDGRVDLNTGQPLPQGHRLINPSNAGGSNVMGPMGPDQTQLRDLRGRVMANQQLSGLIDRATNLIQNDPTIVGLPGTVQRLGQNAVSAARDVANYFGKGSTWEQSLNNVKAEAAHTLGANVVRVLPELFKPQISELEAIHAIMVYKGAEAMFGQSGRDLSDRDVSAARHMIGDPQSLFESSQSVQAKLGVIKQMADHNTSLYSNIIQRGDVQAQPPGQQPGSSAPIQPNPVQTETWIRDPATGRPMRAQ